MIDLRILFIIGLIATAVLAYATVVGTFAAAGWLRRLGERVLQRQALVKPVTPRPALRTGTNLIRADAERRVRTRQAAWRLRC